MIKMLEPLHIKQRQVITVNAILVFWLKKETSAGMCIKPAFLTTNTIRTNYNHHHIHKFGKAGVYKLKCKD
jgi:hypothetical protein